MYIHLKSTMSPKIDVFMWEDAGIWREMMAAVVNIRCACTGRNQASSQPIDFIFGVSHSFPCTELLLESVWMIFLSRTVAPGSRKKNIGLNLPQVSWQCRTNQIKEWNNSEVRSCCSPCHSSHLSCDLHGYLEHSKVLNSEILDVSILWHC